MTVQIDARMNNFIYVALFAPSALHQHQHRREHKVTEMAGTEQREEKHSHKANTHTHTQHAATSHHIEQPGLQLMVILCYFIICQAIDCLACESIRTQFLKSVSLRFAKSKMILKCLLCPRPKHLQFKVTEEKILIFHKLESEISR